MKFAWIYVCVKTVVLLGNTLKHMLIWSSSCTKEVQMHILAARGVLILILRINTMKIPSILMYLDLHLINLSGMGQFCSWTIYLCFCTPLVLFRESASSKFIKSFSWIGRNFKITRKRQELVLRKSCLVTFGALEHLCRVVSEFSLRGYDYVSMNAMHQKAIPPLRRTGFFIHVGSLRLHSPSPNKPVQSVFLLLSNLYRQHDTWSAAL